MHTGYLDAEYIRGKPDAEALQAIADGRGRGGPPAQLPTCILLM
jgi:hypothetical protein